MIVREWSAVVLCPDNLILLTDSHNTELIMNRDMSFCTAMDEKPAENT